MRPRRREYDSLSAGRHGGGHGGELHSDPRPGVDHSPLLDTGGSIALAGVQDGTSGKGCETGGLAEGSVSSHVIIRVPPVVSVSGPGVDGAPWCSLTVEPTPGAPFATTYRLSNSHPSWIGGTVPSQCLDEFRHSVAVSFGEHGSLRRAENRLGKLLLFRGRQPAIDFQVQAVRKWPNVKLNASEFTRIDRADSGVVEQISQGLCADLPLLLRRPRSSGAIAAFSE